MSNLSVGQIIVDAQRMVGRVKDLDTLGSALLVEAEGNNRLVESLRQFQNDIDMLNRISNNKSNVDIVNRIHQQNANSSEILKENRELKICIEDYERALELVMQKYREHTHTKILETKINLKDVYNEKLWTIIREQREKINEMAAVMQRAASIDEGTSNREVEIISRLRLENKTLRELLQISKQFGSASRPIRFNEYLLEEKGVQTEESEIADDSTSSGLSIEAANNNSVVHLNLSKEVGSTVTTSTIAPDNAPKCYANGENNNDTNGQNTLNSIPIATIPEKKVDEATKSAENKLSNALTVNAIVADVVESIEIAKSGVANAT